MQDLEANKEVNITSRYQSQEKNNITGDFEFIVMEKFLSKDNELPIVERLIMRFCFWLKELTLTEEKGFGLETSNVKVEKFPLMVSPPATIRLHRMEEAEEIEQLWIWIVSMSNVRGLRWWKKLLGLFARIIGIEGFGAEVGKLWAALKAIEKIDLQKKLAWLEANSTALENKIK